MANQLYPPGVEIIQEVQTASVSVVTPLLQACIIGPCKQLLDAVTPSGDVNSEALAGTYSGTAAVYDYPNLLEDAVVDVSTVKAYIRFGNANLVELSESAYAVSTEGVTVSAGAGGVTEGTTVGLYISYEALRRDVAAESLNNPNGTKTGITVENISDIESLLGPISARNPLALGVYLAKLNAPLSSIMAVGVDEISSQAPDGTSDAYARALELCERIDVYSLVPLSQSQSVLSLFSAHVDSMSGVHGQKERIAFLNPEMPDHAPDETVASGPYGTVINSSTFETSGILDEVSVNDILNVENSSTQYVIQTIDGSRVTVSPSTLSGTGYIEWYITHPGEELTDKTGIAEAYAKIGESYNNRRIFVVVPEIVEVDIDGIIYELPGYFGCCCIAGQVGELKPQLPLTNVPIAGLVGLDKSNDFFTPTQLNIIAAGGVYILCEEAGSVYCRHQLSTAVMTIETRELSITKQVDYYAKLLRNALKGIVGKSIITKKFLHYEVSPRITGISDYAVSNGIIYSWDLRKLQQSTSSPDTVEITIDVTPVYPCNTIRVTLLI